MRKFTISLLAMICVLGAKAQSLINSNLYTKNLFVYNSAYAGSEGQLFAAFQASNHVSSISNAPKYALFNVHGLVYDNLGFGTSVMADRRGFLERTEGSLAASYRAAFTEHHSITFGINAGFSRERLDGKDVSYNQFVDSTDPVLDTDFYDNTQFTTGFGFVYRFKNLEVSNSFPRVSAGAGLNLELISYAAYSLYSRDSRWLVKPSVTYISLEESKDIANFNLQGEWNEKIWAQAGYLSNGNLSFGMGFNLDFVGIGYAYGYPTGDLSSVSNGMHEAMVTFAFGKADYSHNRDIYGSRFGKKKVSVKSLRKIEDVNYEKQYAELDAKYKSLQDSLKSGKKTQTDQELNVIKESLGELNAQLDKIRDELESVREESDLESFGEPLSIGYYVVVSTCQDLKCAIQEQKQMLKKGTETEIAFSKPKKFYYVFTERIGDFEESIRVMKQMRKEGYPDAWVLVHK